MNGDRPYVRRRAPSLFWPVVLIGAGVVWLLSNMGMLTVNPWFVLARFWPVFLILAGIDILFSRNFWGTIVGGILGLLVVGGVVALLFYAQANPAWVNSLGVPGIVINSADLKTQRLADPLGGAKQADVTLSMGSGSYALSALGDSGNLLEGNIDYYGDLKHDVSVSNDRARVNVSTSWSDFGFLLNPKEKWELYFNPSVQYAFHLNTGSGTHAFDLSKLKLQAATVNGGSGTVDMSLPSEGQYRVTIDGGSGTLSVHVPAGFATRVEYHGGSGSFSPGSLKRASGSDRNGTYESSGFSQSESNVIITVNGGSGTVSIR